MKCVHFQLDDQLYDALQSICTHHGERSHLMRQAVKLIIKQKELLNENNRLPGSANTKVAQSSAASRKNLQPAPGDA